MRPIEISLGFDMSERYKFWMVWRDGTPVTTHRHPCKPDAVEEAQRIASLRPGEAVYVLKTTAAFTAEKAPITHHTLVQDEIPF